MIIYNQTWLANLRLQDQVKDDLDSGLISPEEFKAITQKYLVGFYTPGIFARVGMAILTLIAVLFGDGLLAFMAASANIIESWGFVLFLAMLSYFVLETLTKQNNYFRAGVDDMLTLIAGCQIVAVFVMMIGNADGFNIAISFVVLVTSLWLTIRFSDRLMSAIASCAVLAFIFFVWIQLIPAGLATAPFIMMTASGCLYWLAGRYAGDARYINYRDCLYITQAIALLALYAAGNYFVIQTLSADMAGREGPVPFGRVFWIWTFVVPFVYIGISVRKKDAMLLRIGLLLIAAAVATFRNYYHVLPTEIALTIAGSAMLLVAFAIMRYLKVPKHGITTADPDKINSLDRLRVESLIVAETFSHAPDAPTDDGTKFGGGSFGGGGSSANF
ncbi:hypothetical protein [Mucilaginibacter myungsuensis]|uniref:Uncharacterized protein n=1 Tax=Mucilaginibacter myungsuensis TaxID=649104 RepID=A0A929KWY5_9SPHI|nr:hypothetical protein [Mucilaginibacter myungsuensis]MBE9662192.1 hypothetical protein [Mucilaginibacter myungsuensis]MDN3599374.1 hypothetical protein [Mucilaginibacter myungsuensis]